MFAIQIICDTLGQCYSTGVPWACSKTLMKLTLGGPRYYRNFYMRFHPNLMLFKEPIPFLIYIYVLSFDLIFTVLLIALPLFEGRITRKTWTVNPVCKSSLFCWNMTVRWGLTTHTLQSLTNEFLLAIIRKIFVILGVSWS